MDIVYTTEYGLEESPTFLLDHEELGEDREYTGIMPRGNDTGLICPRCESSNCIFIVGDYTGELDNDWLCLKCKFIFTWELAQIFNQLRENDKEEQDG